MGCPQEFQGVQKDIVVQTKHRHRYSHRWVPQQAQQKETSKKVPKIWARTKNKNCKLRLQLRNHGNAYFGPGSKWPHIKELFSVLLSQVPGNVRVLHVASKYNSVCK